jgi:hypothetical protein
VRRALVHARLAAEVAEQIGQALEAERARHERAAQLIQAACRCFIARCCMAVVPTAAATLQVRVCSEAPSHLGLAHAAALCMPGVNDWGPWTVGNGRLLPYCHAWPIAVLRRALLPRPCPCHSAQSSECAHRPPAVGF